MLSVLLHDYCIAQIQGYMKLLNILLPVGAMVHEMVIIIYPIILE